VYTYILQFRPHVKFGLYHVVLARRLYSQSGVSGKQAAVDFDILLT